MDAKITNMIAGDGLGFSWQVIWSDGHSEHVFPTGKTKADRKANAKRDAIEARRIFNMNNVKFSFVGKDGFPRSI